LAKCSTYSQSKEVNRPWKQGLFFTEYRVLSCEVRVSSRKVQFRVAMFVPRVENSKNFLLLTVRQTVRREWTFGVNGLCKTRARADLRNERTSEPLPTITHKTGSEPVRVEICSYEIKMWCQYIGNLDETTVDLSNMHTKSILCHPAIFSPNGELL
jgi:hypothetical protein